jgi:hypothetical protein
MVALSKGPDASKRGVTLAAVVCALKDMFNFHDSSNDQLLGTLGTVIYADYYRLFPHLKPASNQRKMTP